MEQITTGLVVGITTSVVAAWVGAVAHRRQDEALRASATFFRARVTALENDAPQRAVLHTLALECEARTVARHVAAAEGQSICGLGSRCC